MFVQKGVLLLPKGVTIAERTMTRSLSAMALSSPLSPTQNTTTQTQPPKQHSTRNYVSRAHPRPVPEFSVPTGLQMVLDGVEERKKQRVARWERNKDKRRSKGIEDVGEYRNQNETIEVAINLNVDPRKPGQAMRGSVKLPHGTGKTVSCLVFSDDAATIEKAKSQGHEAGGEELVDRILDGEASIDSYQRALATKDTLPNVQKKLARLLGPRGLMPNAKTNTVFDEGSSLLEALSEQSNTITYRTEAGGILHFPIGKGSFTSQQLMDNLQTVCAEIQEVKPEQYGRGKKKKNKGAGAGSKGNSQKKSKTKYWLKAHLTATQGKSVRLDLRTVDPSSPYFMKEPE